MKNDVVTKIANDVVSLVKLNNRYMDINTPDSEEDILLNKMDILKTKIVNGLVDIGIEEQTAKRMVDYHLNSLYDIVMKRVKQ